MKCSACGKTGVRSTTLAVILGDSKARHGRVCSACEKRGVLIVPLLIPAMLTTAPAERRELRAALAPFVKACEQRAKAYAGAPLNEEKDSIRAEAWEAAAELLRGGRT